MTHKTTAFEDKPALTRDERLAQRLRENLRRRKAQARAMGATEEVADGGDEPSQA